MSQQEVEKVLEGMKRGTLEARTAQPKTFQNSAELLCCKSLLNDSFSELLRTLNVPTAWKNANIVLVPKKGNKDFRNYRTISLLSVGHKLFTNGIVNRISDSLDFPHKGKQAGFRK